MTDRSTVQAGTTRREALAALSASAAGLLLTHGAAAQAARLAIDGPPRAIGEVPFAEPPVIRAESGLLDTTLTVQWHEPMPGRGFRTYDGRFTGPTLRFRPGDRVRVLIANELPPEGSGGHVMNVPHGLDTTNLHTHGLWVSPAGNSDNVLIAVGPGERFQYDYAIPAEHVAGTFWYHPHRHGSVEEQVKTGMAGAIVIEGGLDEVPEVAAATERLMLLQQLAPASTATEAAARRTLAAITGPPDKVTTINALRTPTLAMRPGGLERWRLIAGNANDILHVELRPAGSKERVPLRPIAHDGIPVRDVRSVPRVRLAPGNRVDVLVQPSDPGDYEIWKIGDRSQFDVLPDDELIGHLRVEGEPIAPPLAVPATLPPTLSHPDITADEVTNRRKVLFSVLDEPAPEFVRFLIDNREFEAGRVDQRLELGAVEEWVIENDSDVYHPFHIHVNPFQVLETSDRMIEPGTWHDTVLIPPARFGVPGRVVMRTRVERFVGRFVMHCHILGHEDRGMMQLVEIVPPSG